MPLKYVLNRGARCLVPSAPVCTAREGWIALIDLIRDHEVTAGDGEHGTL